jgi:integrase
LRPLKISVHKLQNGQFVTCFIDPKTGKKRRNRFSTKREANDYKDQIKLRYRMKGEHSFSHHPVAKLMKFHLEKCPNTRVTRNKSLFRSFIKNFGEFNISEVEKSDLMSWFRKRQEAYDLSEKTLNSHKHFLNHFFRFLHDERIIKYNPMEALWFNVNVPRKRQRIVLSVDEVNEILENAPKFDDKYFYPLVYFLAHTGARLGEALKLKKQDIDFKLGQLTFYETKNGENRTLNLSKGLKEFLQTQVQRHNTPYAFCGPNTPGIEKTYTFRMSKRYKAHFPNGKDWTYHAFRHSFAHNFLIKGGNMYELQAILGHKNIRITIDLYGQIQSKEIKNFSPYETNQENAHDF